MKGNNFEYSPSIFSRMSLAFKYSLCVKQTGRNLEA